MQRSVFTAGILIDSGSLASIGTMRMAPEGQWRAQLPHDTPSVTGRQFFLTQTACPIRVEDFSATVSGRMASVGHTSEQRVHSGRQYPRSYDSSGCIRCSKSAEGRSTWLGQTETHNWQAVQCCAKCCALNDPGGKMRVARFGFTLSSITVSPPSTFFFCAFMAAEAAKEVATVMNVLRPLSHFSPFTSHFSLVTSRFSLPVSYTHLTLPTI